MENWNVEKVEDMGYLFEGCVNMEEINLSGWKTTSLLKMNNMYAMFNTNGSNRFDSKLEKIVISNEFDTRHVTTSYTSKVKLSIALISLFLV